MPLAGNLRIREMSAIGDDAVESDTFRVVYCAECGDWERRDAIDLVSGSGWNVACAGAGTLSFGHSPKLRAPTLE